MNHTDNAATATHALPELLLGIECACAGVGQAVKALELYGHLMTDYDFTEDGIRSLGTTIECLAERIQNGLSGIGELANQASISSRRCRLTELAAVSPAKP